MPPRDAASTEASDTARLHGARILLVEDNPVNMMIAAATLAQWGVQVDRGARRPDGDRRRRRRGARAAGRSTCVLMDVQMPVMSGHEATLELRKAWSADALPIIALTAAALVSEREQALAAGMNDFLTKPIDVTAAAPRWRRHVALRAAGVAPATTSALRTPRGGNSRQARPGKGEQGVGQRRRERRRADLADPARRPRAVDQVRLDRRRLGEPNHRAFGKVGLPDDAVDDVDPAVQRRGEREHDRALDLLRDDARVDDGADVGRADDPMHARPAVLDRRLDHLGDDAAEALVQRDAARPPGSSGRDRPCPGQPACSAAKRSTAAWRGAPASSASR